MECSDDDSQTVLENVLSSSDVTTWSPTQQDFTELDFLANNASSSSSASISSNDVSGNDKRNPKRNILSENETETLKGLTVKEISYPEKDGEKGNINKEKGKSKQIVPLLLEMTEPNPETPRGMDLWLLWFDGLKEKENSLISLLSS